MIVRVYWNLHKKRYSVQWKTPKGWRVAYHTSQLWLDAPQFKVSAAGRERVRREHRKNVHAYIVGNLAELDEEDWRFCLEEFDDDGFSVGYNPYHDEQFTVAVDRTLNRFPSTGDGRRVRSFQPIDSAAEALLQTRNGRPAVRVRQPWLPLSARTSDACGSYATA